LGGASEVLQVILKIEYIYKWEVFNSRQLNSTPTGHTLTATPGELCTCHGNYQ